MNSTTAFRISAGIGMLAVALGAFGAHGLQPLLTQNGTTGIWEKAAHYHLVHAGVLLFLATRVPEARRAWWLMLVGVMIFSGCLYLYAVTGWKPLGMIVPVGGTCLLASWGSLLLKPNA